MKTHAEEGEASLIIQRIMDSIAKEVLNEPQLLNDMESPLDLEEQVVCDHAVDLRS